MKETKTKKPANPVRAGALKNPRKTKTAVKPPRVKKGKAADTANVEFAVTVPHGFEKAGIYVCGDRADLGGWIPENALKLVSENGIYKKRVPFKKGERAEFKIIATRDWETVEKGCWYEELQNHTFTADFDKVVEIHVYHFNTII